MTKKKTKTHKTQKAHKTHESKEKHVSDKVSAVSITDNIALIAVVFLVVGLLVGALLSYGAFMANPPTSVNGQGANLGAGAVDVEELKLKVEEYVNTNMLPPEVNFTVNDVNQSSEGIFELSYTITQDGEVVEDGVIHSTKTKLIIGAVVDLDEAIEDDGSGDGAGLVQQEVSQAELYVWGYCPAGISTLDTYAEAAAYLKDVADVSVVLFHDGHGAFETQQNKIQAAIQQLEPEKYWDYAKDFYEDVYPICEGNSGTSLNRGTVECDLEESIKLMTKVGVDSDAVMALVESDGVALFAADRQKATALGINSSPTLVVNGVVLNSFDRTAEGIKSQICGGFLDAPEVCQDALSTVQTAATGSC